MTCWLNWEIHDEQGTNPLGVPGNFEFRVAFDFDPGNFGNSATDAVTLTDSVCKVILTRSHRMRPAQYEVNALTNWFWAVLDKNPEIRDHIATFAAEQMSFCGE